MLIAVTPAAASLSASSGSASGASSPITTWPGVQRLHGRVVWLADHEHDVGGQRLTAAHHAGAGLGVAVVGQPGAIAGPGLDEHVQAGRAQFADCLGHERHPSLARRGLLDHGYLHGQTSLGRQGGFAAYRQPRSQYGRYSVLGRAEWPGTLDVMHHDDVLARRLADARKRLGELHLPTALAEKLHRQLIAICDASKMPEADHATALRRLAAFRATLEQVAAKNRGSGLPSDKSVT